MPNSPQRGWWVAGAVVLSLVATIAIGESLGWRFLAKPLQHLLSGTLDRSVRFSANPETSPADMFRVRFVGGVRLRTAHLEIDAPAWSETPYLLLARDVALDLSYTDLWRAVRGKPLRIQRLQAARLDGHLDRRADGRASWQFGSDPAPPAQLPSFGAIQIAEGVLRYRDVPLKLEIEARASLTQNPSPAPAPSASVMQGDASGHYGKLPFKVVVTASGAPPAGGVQAAPVALKLNATVGRALLDFEGTITDVLHLNGISGHFSLQGPSLAAVGDLAGVTLPTTDEFKTAGEIAKEGDTWRVQIDDATVGASQLNGEFTYEMGRAPPLLTGKLGGVRLLLTDLGPVVGTTPATAASKAALIAPVPAAKPTRGEGMVLPDRPFDLAALRAMDADVAIDIRDVDLNTQWLKPLRPLRGHLKLSGGVLTVQNIDARTGQGRLRGDLRLDGRAAIALLKANLRWNGIRLEEAIRQRRSLSSSPLVSGRLDGRANLRGQGRSTAEILASLKGHARTEVHEGAVSQLAIELAGLDVAESLGMLLKGKERLPMQCAVADLAANGGVFRPNVMVVDTTDSTVWVDGSLSLAGESLDLRAVVMPKDFSPLTLRSPLRVRGTFADPRVSLEKGSLGRKVASAFLLSLATPLAALIPLTDTGDKSEAKSAAAGCRSLMERSKSLPVAAAD